ncbi:hypothetical protein HXX76_003296 [Chlamydomonas incerta]|uniref:Uncharacterized protein n=1 Tax=Chlamydomonas incerta TaxID=51695 RepID=A0A835TE47_CHLIN|nr:hypothetical protein HXX76_003296 [Chlamydomonas incerta]|eukprot:KAG2441678.1 hypothetical protein HXX76_003296 [Chlamydomonas incerta]
MPTPGTCAAYSFQASYGPHPATLQLLWLQPQAPCPVTQPQELTLSPPHSHQQQHGLLALPNELLAQIAGIGLRCGAGTSLMAACRDLRDATAAAILASPGLRLQLAARRLRALFGAYGSDCVTADGIYSCNGARRLLLPDHLSEGQRAEVLLALVKELAVGAAEYAEERLEPAELRAAGWEHHQSQQAAAAGGCGGGAVCMEIEHCESDWGIQTSGGGDGQLLLQRARATSRGSWSCCAHVREQVQQLIVAAARAGDTRSMTGLMRAACC